MTTTPKAALDILAEQELIALVVTRPDTLADLDATLRADDFRDPRHRAVWSAILTLDARRAAIDPVSVCGQLNDEGALNQAGGLEYLHQIVGLSASGQDVPRRAEIIVNASRNRALLTAGDRIVESARQGGDARDNVNTAMQMLDGIVTASTGSGLKPVSELLPGVIDRIAEQAKNDADWSGLPSGFPELDRMIGGFQPGHLIVVAARPSMGKTALAMQIAENTAVQLQQPAAIFDLEMSDQDLLIRTAASMARVPVNRAIAGRMNEDELSRFTNATSVMAPCPLFIDDATEVTPADIRARARRIKRDHGLSLVVVDYLQLMSTVAESRTQEISKISRQMKLLAKELEVPVLLLSQLNRGLELRDNKRPIMADLRESGAIEQDADVIIFIYRDDVYYEQSATPGSAELIIGKQRNGPTGTVWLRYDGAFCRFSPSYQPPTNTVPMPTRASRRRGGFQD